MYQHLNSLTFENFNDDSHDIKNISLPYAITQSKEKYKKSVLLSVNTKYES